MRYQKIPLEEQLNRLAENCRVHPEYVPCAIHLWGEMPIADYFGSTEEGEARCKELMRMLKLPSGKASELTYCDIADRIHFWRQGGMHGYRVKRALQLLAEPLAEGYAAWKKAWEEVKRNEENPT